LHELLYESAKANAVLTLFNTMHCLAGNIIDRTKAILFLVLTRCWHLALSPFPGPATHDAGQEVQVDLVLIVQQNFIVFRLFLVLFQIFCLLLVIGIGAGNTQHGSSHSIAQGVQVCPNGFAADCFKALPNQFSQ
jgi:hypothetical protein